MNFDCCLRPPLLDDPNFFRLCKCAAQTFSAVTEKVAHWIARQIVVGHVLLAVGFRPAEKRCYPDPCIYADDWKCIAHPACAFSVANSGNQRDTVKTLLLRFPHKFRDRA